ncbi:MAG: SDR family NAD(P)-dependent oxidoreductase [Terricaulis sp.]|nr:SDR family NAD(P)-dependent oxidoreductase [Terricaulis sp.]
MNQGSLDRAVVVTGASTGIGRAAVGKAVREGAHVFASVRKAADAESLKSEYGAAVTPLTFDVTDESAIAAAAAEVSAALGGRKLYGLVNNAGVAVPGPLLYMDSEELRRQFEINVLGVHNVTRAFAPLLGADRDRTGKPGRIVMISSVAGQDSNPFLGPYAMSKHALEGYSKSLRRELLLFGIDVIIIGPGAIATPIWDKAEKEDVARFQNTPYGAFIERVAAFMVDNGRKGLPASDVGDLVWFCLSDASPKTRYPILRRPLLDRTLPRLMGPRAVDRIIAKRLGFDKAAP